MVYRCVVYCRVRDCVHCGRGGLIAGVCGHPDHSNVLARDGVSQMVLCGCPRKEPGPRLGVVRLKRPALHGRYMIQPKCCGKRARAKDILETLLSESSDY